MIDRRAHLAQADPAIYTLIQREVERQEHGLELIASENFATMAVMEPMGTALTNKYAEGLPRKRYYGGCEIVDEVEQLAIDRAKALFKAEHVNVQPHSGAQANMAAYLAVAKLGDTLLGLALPHGGHLTHGSPVNFSGMLFRPTAYGVREDTGRIDYDQVREIARRERPRILVGGGSAYARVIDFAALRSVADEVGAIFVVDMAHFAGLVAAGIHPSPVPHAQIVTTTTHKTLRGPRGGLILCLEAYAKDVDKLVFPGIQAVRDPGREERAGAGGGARGARLRDRVGRHRHASHARGPATQGSHGQGSAGPARSRRNHGQQEHHSRRPAVAVRDERDPDRHARRHHARLHGNRNGEGGRHDRHGPHESGRRHAGAGQGRSARADGSISLVRGTLPPGRGSAPWLSGRRAARGRSRCTSPTSSRATSTTTRTGDRWGSWRRPSGSRRRISTSSRTRSWSTWTSPACVRRISRSSSPTASSPSGASASRAARGSRTTTRWRCRWARSSAASGCRCRSTPIRSARATSTASSRCASPRSRRGCRVPSR